RPARLPRLVPAGQLRMGGRLPTALRLGVRRLSVPAADPERQRTLVPGRHRTQRGRACLVMAPQRREAEARVAKEVAARRDRPTLEQVAARASVSRATVSRVINGSTRVAQDIRESVMRAVNALGYVPN